MQILQHSFGSTFRVSLGISANLLIGATQPPSQTINNQQKIMVLSFAEWLNKNFTEINGYYFGCPIKFEGMLLTKDYLKELYNETNNIRQHSK